MFEGLSEKGYKELEKQEIEFHYKLALKALMKVCFFALSINFYFDNKENSQNKRRNSKEKH